MNGEVDLFLLQMSYIELYQLLLDDFVLALYIPKARLAYRLIALEKKHRCLQALAQAINKDVYKSWEL